MPDPTVCIWVSHKALQMARAFLPPLLKKAKREAMPSQSPGWVCRCHSPRRHCPLSAGSGLCRLSTVLQVEYSDTGKSAGIAVLGRGGGDGRGVAGPSLPSPLLTLPPVLGCSDSRLLSILIPGRVPSQRCQRPHSLFSVAGDSLVSNPACFLQGFN